MTTKCWLLLGLVLAAAGCGSQTSETPGAVSPSAGSSGSTPAVTPAAMSGAPALAAGGGGTGVAGVAPIAAGRSGGSAGASVGVAGARAPQAGGGAAAGQPAVAGSAAGNPGSAGSPVAGGSGGGAGGRAGGPAAGSGSAEGLEKFSFFITSYAGLQKLAGKQQGFGGDLRHGQADGLAGADKICSELAETSMPGSAAKGWRAFLSVAQGPMGGPVHAIDRIGEGPWYDRIGRVVAMNKAALLATRPQGADPAIVNDLPNEEGVPNQTPNPGQGPVNNHHMLTGSDAQGKLYNNSVNSTCMNWTSTAQSAGRPRVGFSYPAGNRQHWISGQDEGGCGAGAVLVDKGGSDPSNPIVGSGGGYGGFYCFALKP